MQMPFRWKLKKISLGFSFSTSAVERLPSHNLMNNHFVKEQLKERMNQAQDCIIDAQVSEVVEDWPAVRKCLAEAKVKLESAEAAVGYLERVKHIVPGIGFVKGGA